MFKIGEQAVCVDVGLLYNSHLTKWKTYIVTDVRDNFIQVKDDTGEIRWLEKRKFVEYRPIKNNFTKAALKELKKGKDSKVKNPVLYEFKAPCVQAVDLPEIVQSCTRENKLLVVKVVEKSKRRSSAVVIHASVLSKAVSLGIDLPYNPHEVHYTEAGNAFWVEEKKISEWVKWVKEVEQAQWNEETPVSVTVQKVDV